jgi:hypothetical protein
MAKSNAVQFRGIPLALQAYQSNDIAPFALCMGKQMLYTYEGNDIVEGSNELKAFLKMLEQGGGEGYYTLQVYKLKEGEEIKSGTDFSRSFNFTIFDDTTSLSPYGMAKNSFRMEIQGQIDELREVVLALAKAKDEPEEKPEMSGIGKIANEIWDHPDMKNAIISRVVGFVQKIMPMGNTNTLPAGMAGVEGQQPMQSILDQDQVNKVQQALNVLCAKDPKLGDNLLKVANLIMSDPRKYNMALTML